MAQQKIGILLLLCSLLTLVFIGTAVQKTAYTTDNLILLEVLSPTVISSAGPGNKIQGT